MILVLLLSDMNNTEDKVRIFLPACLYLDDTLKKFRLLFIIDTIKKFTLYRTLFPELVDQLLGILSTYLYRNPSLRFFLSSSLSPRSLPFSLPQCIISHAQGIIQVSHATRVPAGAVAAARRRRPPCTKGSALLSSPDAHLMCFTCSLRIKASAL